MANITDAINEFKIAPNGESVRDAFVEVMTRVNDDNIKISSDYVQVIEAAGQVGSAVSSASTSAALAASKATAASNAASVASGHATTATTKAGEAATSASTATAASNIASNKAGEATTAATNATNAKNISVTKAGEAATSAATATNAASTISAQITTASDSAEASALAAATSATSASNSASTATTKANEVSTAHTTITTKLADTIAARDIAVTKAGEATTAATTSVSIRDELSPQLTTIDQKVLAATDAATLAVSAKDTAVTKASEASASATTASNQSTIATTAATTATTKASEASASATAAEQFAANAEAAVGVTTEERNTWNGKQDALGFVPEDSTQKGTPSGYASLDASGKVPSSQLPVIAGHTHANKDILDKITIGTAVSYDLDSFGDMKTSVYDTTQNGIVDNAEKVNGLTVETAVPINAVFTDTVYTPPSHTSYASGLYKITTNSLGHVSSATAVAKADITGLGIPASDTTYSVVTTSVNGLMSSADKTKMDAISGSNTGDETSATIKTKLGISTISGSNTGDQTLGSFGITSTAEELNALDGITSTVAELNYVSGVTSAIQTQLNAKAASYDLLSLELSKLSSYSTNMDANGIYTNVEWKRANETTYAKSTLTGTSPNYSQVKVDYYDAAGTTIANTITWNISYNANNFSYQKAVI